MDKEYFINNHNEKTNYNTISNNNNINVNRYSVNSLKLISTLARFFFIFGVIFIVFKDFDGHLSIKELFTQFRPFFNSISDFDIADFINTIDIPHIPTISEDLGLITEFDFVLAFVRFINEVDIAILNVLIDLFNGIILLLGYIIQVLYCVFEFIRCLFS